MTTVHDIDLQQVLTERLTAAHPDVLRELLSMFIHTLMAPRPTHCLAPAAGERSGERTNSRNGYRHRDFDTRAGTLDVAIPKLRQGSYFPDWLLERRQRAERALTTVVATCYLLGVSTRATYSTTSPHGAGSRPHRGGWSSPPTSPNLTSRYRARWPQTSTRE